MDRAGLSVALAASVLWAGQALAWLIAATPGDRAPALVREDLEEAQLRASALGPLLALFAALATLGGVAGQAIAGKHMTWMVELEALLTLPAAILLVFHVEHRPLPHSFAHYLPDATRLARLHLGLGSLVVCLLAISFAATPAAWLALVAGCALLALSSAAGTLALIARNTGASPRTGIVVVWWRRWLVWSAPGGCIALAAATIIARYASAQVPALAFIIACGMMLVLSTIGRAIIDRPLWRVLRALPVWGELDRTARARSAKISTLSRRACAIVTWNAILVTVLTVPLTIFALGQQPASRHTSQSNAVSQARMPTATVVPIATITPFAAPTLAGSAAAAQTTLTQSAGGVAVTLTLATSGVGQVPARLSVRDAGGQTIPNATLSVVVAPALLSQQGISLDVVPDPHGQAGDYLATLPLTQPGAWQVVVVVTTPGDNLAASVVFSLEVAG